MQDIFGGGSSNTQAQNQSTSGFSLLPQSIQDAFNSLASGATGTLTSGSPTSATPNSSLFTLPSLPSGSTNALSQLENQNFAITPQSIQTDVAEQMNPYNSSVINQIENAQNGQESQLSSYLSNAGDFGSNRGVVGSSDISNVAANEVGSFLNGEFNTALTNALTTIPQNQAGSAGSAVSSGLTQQSQALQNQQAPLSSLQALAQLLGVLPQSGGSQSTGASSGSSSSSNGILPDIASFFG